MRAFLSLFVGKNPIDEMWQERLGLPSTMRELLALTNPRPSGLVLRACSIKNGQDIWSLTDIQWGEEAAFNSGTYVAILLRHPTACPAGFMELFVPLESAYSALLKRTEWVKENLARAPKAKMLETLMSWLRTELREFERRFVGWAQLHRSEIFVLLREIQANTERYCNGNASNEWECARKAWNL